MLNKGSQTQRAYNVCPIPLKTKLTWNDKSQKRGCPGGTEGHTWEVAQECSGVMEMFYILIGVRVTWIHAFVTIHQPMDVTVVKLYLDLKNRHLNIILYVYTQNNMHMG